METFLTIVHVTACLFLAIVVLLQHGKGADVGATFGGATQTVFGARGAATILSKVTAWAAVTFMLTSLGLSFLGSHGASKSLLADEKPKATPTATGAAGVAVTATPSGTGSPAATVTPTASATPEKK